MGEFMKREDRLSQLERQMQEVLDEVHHICLMFRTVFNITEDSLPEEVEEVGEPS